MKKSFVAPLVLLFLVLNARAQNYRIDWFTMGGGGATSTAGGYSMDGAISDSGAALMSGGGYTLESGLGTIGPEGVEKFYVPNYGSAVVTQLSTNGAGTIFAGPGAGLSGPVGIAIDAAGSVYVGNYANNTIERITQTGLASVFANGGVSRPLGLAFDAAGNLYAANQGNNTIEKFTPDGVGSVFASSGLANPAGLGFDRGGNLYVANYDLNTIVKITPDGIGSVFASDGGLSHPAGLALDSAGNVYVANASTSTILKFTPDGTASVFADVGLFHPFGLAFDHAGNLYAVNQGNNTIEIFTQDGTGSVFATGLDAPYFIAIATSPLPIPVAFGANLILNPGAEEGAASMTGNDVLPVPKWATTGNFTTSIYDASWPASTLGFGSNYFAGGPDTDFSVARQVIDVSTLARLVDSDAVYAELSGYFGGFAEKDDHALLAANFLGVTSNSLASFAVGNILAADRTNLTSIVFCSATNRLPVGTRLVEVLLQMTRDSGSYNDGYADNLSLVLRQGISAQTIFDNTTGSENGYEAASTNNWLANKFCVGPQPFQLDSLTLMLVSGDNNGDPRIRSVALQIYSDDPDTGKPLADTGIIMNLSGATNPITLPISFVEAPIKWVPASALTLEPNTCYWVVLSIASGATVGEIASFSQPTGTAAAYGRTSSADAGATWGTPDPGSNRKMLITGFPVPLAPALSITAVERIGDDLRLTFTTVAGNNYALQSRPDLAAGNWVAVPGISVVGNGSPAQITLPNAFNQPQQFYRVKIVP